jgi:hypothetical protein
MKFIFLALTALCFTPTIAQAQYCDLASCATTINIDGGSNSFYCTGSTSDCTCGPVARMDSWCNVRVQTSSPGAGWYYWDAAVNGKSCWVKNQTCPPNLVDNESIQGSSSELSDVYAPGMTTDYFGYVNEVNQSPSTGRANSYDAKLDSCVGHNNADTYSDNISCYTGCGGTHNAHCTAYGTNDGVPNTYAAVCKDRCDCKYGGTCNGL